MTDAATIKLQGDRAPLKQALDGAKGDFAAFGDKVHSNMQHTGKQIANTFQGAGKAAGGAFAGAFNAALGPIGWIMAALGATVAWAKDMVEGAAKAQMASARLAGVLESTGQAAGFSQKQLAEMAKQMRENSPFTMGAIREAQTLISTFKNVRGENFQRVLELSGDLAAAMGTDLKEASTSLGKAINDPVKGMEQLAEKGVVFNEQQKNMIRAMVEAGDVVGAQKMMLDKLQATYGEVAETVGGTVAARWEKAKESFYKVGKVVGEHLLQQIEKVMPYIEKTAVLFETYVVPAVDVVMDVFIALCDVIGAVVKPIFEGLLFTAVAVFTGIQVAVEEWQSVVESCFYGVALVGVKSFNILAHYLGTVLPELLSWFGRNWVKIFTDLGNFLATVTGNMYNNLVGFFKSVWSWLTGNGWDWSWKSLTKGFEATLDEMPKIAERKKGEVEKSLEIKYDQASSRSGDAYMKRLGENLNAMGFDNSGSWAPGKEKKSNKQIAYDKAALDKPYEVTTAPQTGDKAGDKEKEIKASFVGLEEMNKKIQAAAAGTKSPEEKMVEETKKANEKADKTAKATEQTADQMKTLNSKFDALLAVNQGQLEKLGTVGALR